MKTVLDAIAEINEPLMVDVISSGATALRKYIGSAHNQHKVEFRNAVSEMGLALDKADLAIGAAGINSWERCCLGLPSLVVAIADNQLENTRNLVEAGAAVQVLSLIHI